LLRAGRFGDSTGLLGGAVEKNCSRWLASEGYTKRLAHERGVSVFFVSRSRIMFHGASRRSFLADIGRGTLMAALGPAMAFELGLASPALAEDLDHRLEFGDLEPLVCGLQETTLDGLQPMLVDQLQRGVSLKTLVAGAALANARTFGGEDYIGFHTFMALAPALRMSQLMPLGAEALPVLKVLYRNTQRIQAFGGRGAERLDPVEAGGPAVPAAADALQQAIRTKQREEAERILAQLVAADAQQGLDALMPVVQDHAEVHRTVLPYRAWEMREIVGPEHALTLLRQSLRYCVRNTRDSAAQETSDQARVVTELFDRYGLVAKHPGSTPGDDATVERLCGVFSTGSPHESAEAAAEALSTGLAPAVVGEAISLAASRLVLRDGGRLPHWEDRLKVAGSVHGDSIGVHASDAANAWRNLARVSSGRNQFACLIVGAFQVARDRLNSPNLMREPLPARHHLQEIRSSEPDQLLVLLDEAIRNNLQGQATAIAQHYGELELPAKGLFHKLVEYAVSEDGALHAEKYFQTVWDDFHTTRASLRWNHLVGLARVTASEYGRPAAGQQEARELLKVTKTT
jgi:hypothetical protein